MAVLASAVGASAVTVRRDLAALGEVGQVIVDGPLTPAWRERLGGGGTEVLEVAPCDTGSP